MDIGRLGWGTEQQLLDYIAQGAMGYGEFNDDSD